ncbi:unnamed protein product, partial [Thelazia callipaeda]|uniref:EGF-like domain-containing protein n=1 Tax=Thelazia callipaeda TaxID=103827 RepID=A0A0N5CTJ0_THECL
CTCCFNQPLAFCNQLQCRNAQPLFGAVDNTTCICYMPSHYPYSICTQHTRLTYDDELTLSTSTNIELQGHYLKYPVHQYRDSSTITKFYGIQITPALAVISILGMLGIIMLLTTILLVARACRTHREHHNRETKRELAQSILLEQRAEDEKYLP